MNRITRAGVLWALAMITAIGAACNGSGGGCTTCPPPPPPETKIIGLVDPVDGLVLEEGEPIPCTVPTIEPSAGRRARFYLNQVKSTPRLACGQIGGVGGEFVLAYFVQGNPIFYPPVGSHTVIYAVFMSDPAAPDGLGELVAKVERSIMVVPKEE